MKKKTKLIKLWNSYFSPRNLLLCFRAKHIFKFPTPSWRGMRPMRRDRQMMWEVSHSCWNTHYMTRLHYQLSENKCFINHKKFIQIQLPKISNSRLTRLPVILWSQSKYHLFFTPKIMSLFRILQIPISPFLLFILLSPSFFNYR